jgi:hypothetical protein
MGFPYFENPGYKSGYEHLLVHAFNAIGASRADFYSNGIVLRDTRLLFYTHLAEKIDGCNGSLVTARFEIGEVGYS